MSRFIGKYLLFAFLLLAPNPGLFAQTHFAYTAGTTDSMTVQIAALPVIYQAPISSGDEIGVFTPAGLCVGAIVWYEPSPLTVLITVWGDSPLTAQVEGAKNGEQLVFKVWDSSSAKVYLANAQSGSGILHYTADAMDIVTLFSVDLTQVLYTTDEATGGSTPVDTNYYKQQEIVTVLDNSGFLTRTGHSFAAWNTAADGSGTDYLPGATFTLATSSAYLYLYPKWTTSLFTITFDKNDPSASGTMAAQTIAYNSSANLNVNTFSKTGWVFIGWASDPVGMAEFNDGAPYMMGDANVTLFAQWNENPSYRVIYYKNGASGGSVPVDSVKYPSRATATVLGNTGSLVNTGYTFSGWNTAANGSGTSYLPSTSIAIDSADIHLYAKWSANTYTIFFNKNDSSAGGTMTAQSANSNSTIILKSNTFVKTGWTFAGWALTPEGQVVYSNGESLHLFTSDVTLYAKWTGNSFTVTFNKNDSNAVGSMGIQTISSTTSANLFQNAYSKAGWAFSGWATTPEGPVVYPDGAMFAMSSANVTMYAKWTALALAVTFNKNDVDATGIMDVQTIECGSSAPLAANLFLKAGWVFSGWALTSNGPVAYVNKATFSMGTSNVTLYARWNITTNVFVGRSELIPPSFNISHPRGKFILVEVPQRVGLLPVPVKVELFDVRGRRLFVMVDREMRPGYYTVVLPTMGNMLPGCGICRMEAGKFHKAIKVILMK